MASGTINTVIQSFPQFGLRHALDGRQTRIALAAFNLRQMLRPNWQLRAHLGRQHLQRQTTLVALAVQEGGNQSVHGRSVTQPRANLSYDRVNSCWGRVFFGMGSRPVGWSDTFTRCSGKKPSPRARGSGKVDNHPKPYSLALNSTQVLRELVRNQSPLHHHNNIQRRLTEVSGAFFLGKNP